MAIDEETREVVRLRRVADLFALQTAADLDAFLATDPKTKDDPEVRAQWRTALQAAVPRLREPA